MFDTPNTQPVRRHDIEKRINDAVAANPGAWRKSIAKYLDIMTDWKRDNEKRRSHLGASAIGNACDRAVALSYRHASPDPADGNARMIRLFNRGHMEEARIAAMLEVAGIGARYTGKTGGQITYKIDALQGSVDGVCRIDGELHVLEFKTMSSKSFASLVKKGEIKHQHIVQMQCGMTGLGIGHALYVAVCKDNDDVACFTLTCDRAVADDADNLAYDIVHGLIPHVTREANSWDCRWCDHKAICHEGAAPLKSCRTCIRAQTDGNGVWTCGIAEFGTVCDDYSPIEQYGVSHDD